MSDVECSVRNILPRYSAQQWRILIAVELASRKRPGGCGVTYAGLAGHWFFDAKLNVRGVSLPEAPSLSDATLAQLRALWAHLKLSHSRLKIVSAHQNYGSAITPSLQCAGCCWRQFSPTNFLARQCTNIWFPVVSLCCLPMKQLLG